MLTLINDTMNSGLYFKLPVLQRSISGLSESTHKTTGKEKKKSAFTERYSTNLRHNLSELIPECPKTVNINPLRILYSENYNYWLVI